MPQSETSLMTNRRSAFLFRDGYDWPEYAEIPRNKKKEFCCWWPECNKTFTRKYHLQRHITHLHLKEGISCPLCSKIFRDRPALEMHVEAIHPNADAREVREQGTLQRLGEGERLRIPRPGEKNFPTKVSNKISRQKKSSSPCVAASRRRYNKPSPSPYDHQTLSRDNSSSSPLASDDSEREDSDDPPPPPRRQPRRTCRKSPDRSCKQTTIVAVQKGEGESARANLKAAATAAAKPPLASDDSERGDSDDTPPPPPPPPRQSRRTRRKTPGRSCKKQTTIVPVQKGGNKSARANLKAAAAAKPSVITMSSDEDIAIRCQRRPRPLWQKPNIATSATTALQLHHDDGDDSDDDNDDSDDDNDDSDDDNDDDSDGDDGNNEMRTSPPPSLTSPQTSLQ